MNLSTNSKKWIKIIITTKLEKNSLNKISKKLKIFILKISFFHYLFFKNKIYIY
jgi:hypothetical protein